MRSVSLEAAIHIARALERIREGRFEAALEQLEAVTDVAPDLREVWGCKALVARQLGLDELARQARERLLALSPAAGNA
jgi:Tfp pilus assembly protein PilF